MCGEGGNHSWREDLNLLIKSLGLLQWPGSATPTSRFLRRGGVPACLFKLSSLGGGEAYF